MVSFQLRSIPGAAWPQVPTPEVSQLWAAYLELDRTQWLSSDQLEELQLRHTPGYEDGDRYRIMALERRE